MKKHLTSIQSTRPGQQLSIFTYDDRLMKLNYKSQILKLFNHLQSILTLRSYLLFRDFHTIFQNSQNFFFKILGVANTQQLWNFVFPNIKQDQKIHQKQQISFLVKIVLQIDKLRKSSASQGKTKQFQALKNAMQIIQQKTAQYQQAIRNKKYNDKLQRKLKQKQLKNQSFNKFQQAVKQNLEKKQKNMKNSFLQKIHNEDQRSFIQTQKELTRHLYKVKPSKLLSQAKDLSLRVKLSPYAAELKRNYDYKTLQSSLSKTLDLDMNRKLSMISHMKKVEKDKLNRDHKKRYSVLESHFEKQKTLTERQLQFERKQMQNFIHIDMQKLYEKNIRKQYSRINSLQKSFNAYNMNSDSKQIRKIIRNHKQTIQFSNQISEVGNLRTSNNYQPSYGTMLNQMLEDEYVNNEQRRQSQHEKKILRRFNRSSKEIQKQGDSDVEADDICGSNKRIQRLGRQKSLVGLYDNELKEII